MKIEQIKVTFTFYTVVGSYLTVRQYEHLSPYFLLFCLGTLVFTYTLPPLLYYDAYKVRENSVRNKKMFYVALTESYPRYLRVLQRKVIMSHKLLCTVNAECHYSLLSTLYAAANTAL